MTKRRRMTVVTAIQAAALGILTIFGAHAASQGHARAADPACLALSAPQCTAPSTAPDPTPPEIRG